jgi:hypothetical protein
MARRDSAGVRLITRNGNDFTDRFPFIVMAVKSLPVRSCERPKKIGAAKRRSKLAVKRAGRVARCFGSINRTC